MEKHFFQRIEERIGKSKNPKELKIFLQKRLDQELEIDSKLDNFEKNLEEPKYVKIYNRKINKDNLLYNISMAGIFFGFGFMLSGGSFWIGVIATAILSPSMEWFEVDKIIKIKEN